MEADLDKKQSLPTHRTILSNVETESRNIQGYIAMVLPNFFR
jgi:hypothetical protein